MKASKLIEVLQRKLDKYGDLPVRHRGICGDDEDVLEVVAYNAVEKLPLSNDDAVEIYLH